MLRAYRGRRAKDASIAREDAAIWATDDKDGRACGAAEPWVAIIGSPRWREQELIDEDRARGAAAALRLAYRRWGKTLFERIAGDFALAILDPQSGSAMLATDRMGVHGLYYGQKDGVFVFGSTADLVRGYPGFGATIPAQAIYNYLQAYVCRSPATIYTEQRKLGPAECLHWRNGEASVETYWRTAFVPDRARNPAELAAQLVTEVRAAVGRSLPDGRQEGVGAFLSGGLDSSTVVGMLSELSPDPIDTFTIGFDEKSYDEMFYADATSRKFGTTPHRYYLTPEDVAQAAPKIAAYFDEPFGNSSAVPVYFCAIQAREAGLTSLLAGDGGDEILAGNSRYLEQQRYERYRQLPAVLRGGIGLLAHHAPLLRQTALWGKARRFIARAAMPLPERLEAFSFYQIDRMSEVFEPDVLRGLDLDAPWRDMRATYMGASSGDPLHRMMHLDLRQTLADNDLKKVTAMCDFAGIGVRFPFLDDDLVAFCSTIPPAFHLKDGRLRAFFKDAFSGFLPVEVIE
jgi:asparagine synthase (glutamine-hydrolysing)